jgi:hypothetical protein
MSHPGGGAKSAMPTFASLEALDQRRALGTAISILKSLPAESLRQIEAEFQPENQNRPKSKDELDRVLTEYVIELYNSGSSKLTAFENYVDGVSRQRLRRR